MGWSSCSEDGYYISGLYRNSDNELKDIDRLRCCSMIVDDRGDDCPIPKSELYLVVCHVGTSCARNNAATPDTKSTTRT
jgi:hypothetical protein